jgi:hypothetical protein
VRKSLRFAPLFVVVLLSACATMDASAPPVPAGAEASTRTEANGDVVTEYRVGGALAMVKVQPANGPTWYLVDSDGDGRLDRTSGEARDAPVYFKLYSW